MIALSKYTMLLSAISLVVAEELPGPSTGTMPSNPPPTGGDPVTMPSPPTSSGMKPVQMPSNPSSQVVVTSMGPPTGDDEQPHKYCHTPDDCCKGNGFNLLGVFSCCKSSYGFITSSSCYCSVVTERMPKRLRRRQGLSKDNGRKLSFVPELNFEDDSCGGDVQGSCETKVEVTSSITSLPASLTAREKEEEDEREGKGSKRNGIFEQEEAIFSDQPIQSSQTETWSCQVCTFVNSSTKPKCEICDSKRPTVLRAHRKKVKRERYRHRQQKKQTLVAKTSLHQINDQELSFPYREKKVKRKRLRRRRDREDSILSQISDSTDTLQGAITDDNQDVFSQVNTQVNTQVSSQVSNHVNSQVSNHVNSQVSSHVNSQVSSSQDTKIQNKFRRGYGSKIIKKTKPAGRVNLTKYPSSHVEEITDLTMENSSIENDSYSYSNETAFSDCGLISQVQTTLHQRNSSQNQSKMSPSRQRNSLVIDDDLLSSISQHDNMIQRTNETGFKDHLTIHQWMHNGGVTNHAQLHYPRRETSGHNDLTKVIDTRRVKEIQTWLLHHTNPTDAQKHYRPPALLILTGTSGCGKSSTVRVLCSMYGINIVTWDPYSYLKRSKSRQVAYSSSTSWLTSSTRSEDFHDFMARALTYRALKFERRPGLLLKKSSTKTAMKEKIDNKDVTDMKETFDNKDIQSSSSGKPSIILLEDIPLPSSRNKSKWSKSEREWIATLNTELKAVVARNHAVGSRMIVVWVLTCDKGSKDYLTSAFLDPAVTNRSCTINFNRITKTRMVKYLSSIVFREGNKGCDEQHLKISPDRVATIALLANGDVRKAINALHFEMNPTRTEEEEDVIETSTATSIGFPNAQPKKKSRRTILLKRTSTKLKSQTKTKKKAKASSGIHALARLLYAKRLPSWPKYTKAYTSSTYHNHYTSKKAYTECGNHHFSIAHQWLGSWSCSPSTLVLSNVRAGSSSSTKTTGLGQSATSLPPPPLEFDPDQTILHDIPMGLGTIRSMLSCNVPQFYVNTNTTDGLEALWRSLDCLSLADELAESVTYDRRSSTFPHNTVAALIARCMLYKDDGKPRSSKASSSSSKASSSSSSTSAKRFSFLSLRNHPNLPCDPGIENKGAEEQKRHWFKLKLGKKLERQFTQAPSHSMSTGLPAVTHGRRQQDLSSLTSMVDATEMKMQEVSKGERERGMKEMLEYDPIEEEDDF
eukprot:g1897.t1